MADPRRRLQGNAPGPFFVYSTCIDCDTCRQLAPSVFEERGGTSIVARQPSSPDASRAAMRALVACPTGSIGGEGDAKAAIASFPTRYDDDVWFCGFPSEHSYGAWSWLVTRPDGNVLIDCPRYTAPLAARIEAMGGVRWIFLTHKDDVADHARWAEKLGATRVMHADDGAARLGVEHILTGSDPIRLADDLLVIPTPGHTRGHCVLLFRDQALFSRDHLAGSGDELTAYRGVCWYSWSEQTKSMARLLDYRFRGVFPGHGPVLQTSEDDMHVQLERCVAWMRSVR
jgi:glyoxylase-like metal-dependent hydrolase (beta-lactamase superfamily II)/ferredoxin